MSEKKFYAHQKDLEKLNQTSDDSNRCDHCGVTLPVHYRQRIDWIEGRQIKRRPLCSTCAKRDRELLMAVLECVRLYGGMVTLLEVVDLYGDNDQAKAMFFDPFLKVRKQFIGEDGLKVKDLDAWIKEGIFEMTGNEKISVQSSPFRKELLTKEEKDKNISYSPNAQDFINGAKKSTIPNFSGSLSRKREAGGASIGKHRWQETRNKK